MCDAPQNCEVLEKYRDFVLGLARLHIDKRLARKLDADDLAQETLLKAYAGWVSMRGTTPGQVKSWLRTILLRTLWDALAKILPEMEVERPLGDVVQSSSAQLANFLAAADTTPGAHALRNEQATQLEEAMLALPERQREAVRLKHLLGWSAAAISEHMSTSTSAVAGLLNHGLVKLNKLLTELESTCGNSP